MRVLVLGQGGREHAIVRALKHSPSVTEIHAMPGNPGMATEALCHSVSEMTAGPVLKWLERNHMDLVIIGPEAYLANGLADEIRKAGFPIVGTSIEAAQLEASKVFAKEFMREANVPTARFEVVSTPEELVKASAQFSAPYVLKADGLAAGKGVFICKTKEELFAVGEDLFVKKTLGLAGEKAVLEEFQPGWELSLLALTNGESFELLPIAQDHKRLLDKDEGPNTGGMGTVAPLTIEDSLLKQICDRIVAPTVQQMKSMGLYYRGVIFIGVMVTPAGPMTLEYNTRFGDPETQVLLPLLDGDWGLVFKSLANGELMPLKWKKLSTACVVMAAPGYPDSPKKGVVIDGDPLAQTASSYFLHAGTGRNDQGQWITSGGRVLNAVAVGSSSEEAIRLAYDQAKKVLWSGQLMRRDIGAKALLGFSTYQKSP